MMAQKKWLYGTVAFLAVVLTLSGFVALATEAGSAADPLASIGYLEQEFTPSLMQKINAAVEQQVKLYGAEMDTKYSKLSATIEERINGINGDGSGSLANDTEFINAVAAAVIAQMPPTTSGGTGGGGDGTFKRVDVSNGKTITLDIGSEVFLRLGSATCVASSSPGLINLTDGGVLENGSAMERNKHYICTIAGRGFKATTNDVTVFIRGTYTES